MRSVRGPSVTGTSLRSQVADLFRQLVETSDEFMLVADASGRIAFASPAVGRSLGLPMSDVLGQELRLLLSPGDRARLQAAFQTLLADRSAAPASLETEWIGRGGHARRLLLRLHRVGGDSEPVTVVAYAGRAGSEREHAKPRHRESARLEAILDGMLDPVVAIDPRGTITGASQSCARVFGYTPVELVGQNVKLLMPEPHRSEHDRYLSRYRETGRTHILGNTRELPVQRKDGVVIDCELSVSRIELPDQEEPIYCGSFRDITERKRFQRAVNESERRFRAIFEKEYEFVGLLDPQGTLLEANHAALEVVGRGRDEVVGQPFWHTPWWAHSPQEQQRLRSGIEAAARGEFVRFETTHQAHDGRILSVDFSLKPIYGDGGELQYLLPEGRDISDIRLAQQRETAMMRALAEIGESASVLAHEIKNPITAVNTALRAVAKHLGASEQEILGELVEKMQKLEKLMRRTLSLARPLDLHPQAYSARALFEDVVRFMRPLLEHNRIVLEISVSPDFPTLSVDPQLFEEMLINLVRNAVDAVEEDGRVRLTADRSGGPGSSLRITVDDDGPGIPESVLKTLFKPFVSTKANGTGLGLALARKVVEAHGGTLDCHNSPLGGARFEILLPA